MLNKSKFIMTPIVFACCLFARRFFNVNSSISIVTIMCLIFACFFWCSLLRPSKVFYVHHYLDHQHKQFITVAIFHDHYMVLPVLIQLSKVFWSSASSVHQNCHSSLPGSSGPQALQSIWCRGGGLEPGGRGGAHKASCEYQGLNWWWILGGKYLVVNTWW